MGHMGVGKRRTTQTVVLASLMVTSGGLGGSFGLLGRYCLLWLVCNGWMGGLGGVAAWSSANKSRREFVLDASTALTVTGAAWAPDKAAALAGTSTNGLGAKLAQRDASVLKNSVFNVPPSAQVYPEFLRGEWQVDCTFRGYLFPSKTISKETLYANTAIPGFQKCSIVALSDLGRERTRYSMKIDADTGWEDRSFTLQEQINANLEFRAVQSISYNVRSNPNRLSIDFVPRLTRNAERIELFCNARESELVAAGDEDVFVCSEYIRQVTFSLSQEFGVARQVVGNYAHFWTWRKLDGRPEEENMLRGNLLTAAYLDPQDALFFQEPSKPVVVYSHDLVARRIEKQQEE